MSESLRNDGRIWVPEECRRDRPAEQIPEDDRDYYLERLYPSFGNLAPRDIVVARRQASWSTQGQGVGPLKNGVYLDFADAIERLGKDVIQERYGNLFEMYERITGENPYKRADAHLPGRPLHDGRAVGRLRADDHRPRPVLPPVRPTSPTTAPTASAPRRSCRAWPTATSCCRTPSATTWLRSGSTSRSPAPTTPSSRRPSRRRTDRFDGYLAISGTRSPDWFHRELGKIIWDYCGMERTKQGLEKALSEIPALYEEFKKDLRVTGDGDHSTRPSRRPAGSTTSSSSAC